MELENAIVEVFTRAFEPRARQVYDGQRPYESFLMGIARNYLLELMRNREHPAGLEVSAELEAATAEQARLTAELELATAARAPARPGARRGAREPRGRARTPRRVPEHGGRPR